LDNRFHNFSLFIILARWFVKESRPTIEMTWGETSHTQAKMKEETSNKSRCFALTSNELLCLTLA